MLGNQKIAVVVPAHNESHLILRAIRSIPPFVDNIIVVDDASTDDTAVILEHQADCQEVVLVRHRLNRGVGGAIVTGYKKAISLKAQLVAVMAGDAQMDPDDLPFLLEPLIQGTSDYTKGDRLSWPGVFKIMPLVRFIGNHILSRLTRISSGFSNIRDSQCGYTAITGELLKRIELDSLWPRYGFPNDMLAKIHAVGGRVENIVVRPIYAEEISGISLSTALFRVPAVLLRSLLWRLKKEKQLSGQIDVVPLKPIDG
jgi:glycosyltransferase involved in cell wall biosynthesis